MAAHSSILARNISWTELGGLQSTGHKESDVAEHTHTTQLSEMTAKSTAATL